ncbi:hypothetical protein [uncultured Megasphaera sp.]|uniref:hypothetical protein n=1 Tax=uncultured Megasphaera sp. TaxID=165188 RepID=UPI00265A7E19|nr:hypothetical protein [uncultured Megasphaera sp.]
MKIRRIGILVFLVFLCSAAGIVCAASQAAAGTEQTIAVSDDYYTNTGSRYTKIVQLLTSLPPDQTGLTGKDTLRMEKKKVGGYFYHVQALQKGSRLVVGDYYVAKDQSCVWRRTHEGTSLIYGSAESLLKKTTVTFYPERLSVGQYGVVRVSVPGAMPYDIKITSLSPKVVTVSEDMNLVPAASGKADMVVDITIGGVTRTFTKTLSVIDKADDVQDNRRSPSVGIGIGWGSGGWHGGGISIGVGPW